MPIIFTEKECRKLTDEFIFTFYRAFLDRNKDSDFSYFYSKIELYQELFPSLVTGVRKDDIKRVIQNLFKMRPDTPTEEDRDHFNEAFEYISKRVENFKNRDTRKKIEY